jgi:hypothetical protein
VPLLLFVGERHNVLNIVPREAKANAMNSKTRMTTFKKLADAGELAPLLVQLMMAVNDLSIADQGLRYWHSEIPVPYQNRVPGSKSYFVRLQIAHTFEALKVIYRLKNTPAFMAKVAQCDRATTAAFNRLVAVIGTEEYKRMKRLPDAITFHYQTQAIQDAINRQAPSFPITPCRFRSAARHWTGILSREIASLTVSSSDTRWR